MWTRQDSGSTGSWNETKNFMGGKTQEVAKKRESLGIHWNAIEEGTSQGMWDGDCEFYLW